jgi:hypothetical protein
MINQKTFVLKVFTNKVARIRWLGNSVRMEENSPCKKDNLLPTGRLSEKGKTQINVAL